MSRDSLDQLGARLFEVARKELPPQGAAQRALEGARRAALADPTSRSGAGRGPRPKLLLWAAALAFGLGLVAVALRPQPPIPISHEPLATPSQARASEPVIVPQPSAPATASVQVRAAPRAVPSPTRAPPATLSDELELLKVAQNALAAGNTGVALQALDRYEHTLTGKKKLRAEATLLRVETLSRAGQTQAAAALARGFIAENPTSPLVDRARSFIHEGN